MKTKRLRSSRAIANTLVFWADYWYGFGVSGTFAANGDPVPNTMIYVILNGMEFKHLV